MNKLIMTRWEEQILTALVSERGVIQMQFEESENKSTLNNIYIGKVKNIVKNINAAFVEFATGVMGYYSLTDNPHHYFVGNRRSENNITRANAASVKAGDEIIVQVAKEGVKTKAPVLTSKLSFPGKYLVLTTGKHQLGFSGKITDSDWKEELKPQILEKMEQDFGIIIRTNAKETDTERILTELDLLKKRCQTLFEGASYRTCYSQLYQAPPAYLSSLRDVYAEGMSAILTDDEEIFQCMQDYLRISQPEDLPKLALHQDKLVSLCKLYSLDTALAHALNKKVWLKSGGYLVIEPTEALVVIDVNTGKYAGKRTLQETIRKINLEAAEEIGCQLRIRNLSGIIVVDFIDMELEEDRKLLLSHLEQIVSKDPIKTNVMGISKLNLVEMTRKKIRKPLYEQISNSSV